MANKAKRVTKKEMVEAVRNGIGCPLDARGISCRFPDELNCDRCHRPIKAAIISLIRQAGRGR
jgi:hypothetical protein